MKKLSKQLQAQWDDAVEAATQEQTRASEMAAERLSQTAGLPLQAGLKSGLWGASATHGCTNHTCGESKYCTA
jgi:hypothetical protein